MKTFVFMVFVPVIGQPHNFQSTTVKKVAETFEEAIASLTETHPDHCIGKHLKGLWFIEGEEHAST